MQCGIVALSASADKGKAAFDLTTGPAIAFY